MPFQKGQSGNPKGRPHGTTRTGKLIAMLEPHAPALVDKVVELALNGDTTALRLCLERLYPALKAKEEAIPIDDLDANASVSEQAKSVINALAQGELSTAQASSVMQSLSAQARIIEIDELEQRVRQLEEVNNH